MTLQFPLRTHLMLDMSYARLEQNAAALRKASSGGGGGGTSNATPSQGFTFFGLYKRPFLSKEDRKPAGAKAANTIAGGIPDPMPPAVVQGSPSAGTAQQSSEPVTIGTLKQDCLMIPMGRMARFFPAGHSVPSKTDPGRVRMLEASDPHLKVVFHMMTPCKPLLPSMDSPLFNKHKHQKECVIKAFKAAAGAASCPQLQGMILMNLEQECEEGKVEFSFIIVWIVDMLAIDGAGLIKKVRQHSLEMLDPSKTGFTCGHYFDTYDEVVTLARPPIEKLCRKASSSGTGYIISVFRVFEGDDGQKFERNWLSWTGAKTLYRSLTSDLDLKRFTLHKSTPQHGVLHYILLCDCSNFLSHISNAVHAVPKLRMRLCGDVGLYRPIATL